MNGAIAWFARNRVAANLLMLFIMASGLMTAASLRRESLPEFSLELIQVTVEYLGAAPEEVEDSVCVRIEEAVQGIDHVKRIRSVSSEGIGTVIIELERGTDVREVLDDVKARVDAIDTFPEETEKPVIREVTNRRQAINVAVWGNADEVTLKRLAEQVRDDLASLPGITQVELSNVRPYEISIEVSETALRRHGLTFDRVARAVRESSLDLPGGSVKTTGGEILLRAKGQARRGGEFERLVLMTRPDGTHLLLGSVANVVDGFAETDQISRFDGMNAVQIEVFRTGEQNVIEITDNVRSYVEAARERMPEGVTLSTWQDQSKNLRDRLDVLTRNGIAGFILVFITLALFLRLRLAFWVSLGIPISFLGAIALMPALDVSVNLISLFAFILVLGIVVDDAIIVGENIFTHQQRTRQGLKGAIEGAQEVAVPVTFAVLTTIVVFIPVLVVPGTLGKFIGVIPLIVIPSLLFSLVESMWILPAHLSHMRRMRPSGRPGPWRRFQARFTAGLEWFIWQVYHPVLRLGLRLRYVTLAIAVSTLILTMGMVGGGWVRFEFFPPIEADAISASLTMPQGTPVEVTAGAVRRIEEAAEELRRQLEEETGRDLYRHVITSVGSQPYRGLQRVNSGEGTPRLASSHEGEVVIELTPAEQRTIGSALLAARWRELTGAIPDAVELVFGSSLFTPGEDINVQLTGPDLDGLRRAADRLEQRLGEYAGVYEITDTFREGKKEIRLGIRPAAELLGLQLSDLARQVRQAFYGEEAQRIVRGRDDIRVMVRYPLRERRSMGDLENMRIRTQDGREVPFGEVATVRPGRGYASIQRVDRRRAVNVIADVDPKEATTGDVIADLTARVLPEILSEFPGVRYSLEGQSAERRDTLGGLFRGFGIAMIAIFALLAVPLRSYVQPLIIMTAIPFGLVGAVWGHMILGLNLTMLSMFGLVALAGVVVNDSLVMVDFINRHRKSEADLHAAVRRAGVSRFRPILLTSMTTFAGLTPLMFERSIQAQFLIPMAVSLAFGVVFSTVISLVIVPTCYVVLSDLKGIARRLLAAPGGVPTAAPPPAAPAGAGPEGVSPAG